MPEQKSSRTNHLTVHHRIQIMKLKLHNIVILFLTLLTVFLLLRHGHAISEVVDHLGRIGPGHSNDEKTVGLLALGFIGVTLVTIVKLFAQDRRQTPPERRRGPPED